jgi:hypothetical protein
MSPRERWQRYLSYLEMKVFERDWHGVADAAMDIRQLEAEHPSLRQVPLSARQPTPTEPAA